MEHIPPPNTSNGAPKQTKIADHIFMKILPQMYIGIRKSFVTSPLHESRLHWIHDPNPNQTHRIKPKPTVPRNNNNSVPRNNDDTVPRNNNTIQNNNARAREPLEIIPSASWYNSNLPLPSASSPRKNICKQVPRSNNQNNETIQVRNEANSSPQPPKKKRDRKHRRERRARERENRSESFIHDARWANQRSLVPGSSSVPVRMTQSSSSSSSSSRGDRLG